MVRASLKVSASVRESVGWVKVKTYCSTGVVGDGMAKTLIMALAEVAGVAWRSVVCKSVPVTHEEQ